MLALWNFPHLVIHWFLSHYLTFQQPANSLTIEGSYWPQEFTIDHVGYSWFILSHPHPSAPNPSPLLRPSHPPSLTHTIFSLFFLSLVNGISLPARPDGDGEGAHGGLGHGGGSGVWVPAQGGNPREAFWAGCGARHLLPPPPRPPPPEDQFMWDFSFYCWLVILLLIFFVYMNNVILVYPPPSPWYSLLRSDNNEG